MEQNRTPPKDVAKAPDQEMEQNTIPPKEIAKALQDQANEPTPGCSRHSPQKKKSRDRSMPLLVHSDDPFTCTSEAYEAEQESDSTSTEERRQALRKAEEAVARGGFDDASTIGSLTGSSFTSSAINTQKTVAIVRRDQKAIQKEEFRNLRRKIVNALVADFYKYKSKTPNFESEGQANGPQFEDQHLNEVGSYILCCKNQNTLEWLQQLDLSINGVIYDVVLGDEIPKLRKLSMTVPTYGMGDEITVTKILELLSWQNKGIYVSKWNKVAESRVDNNFTLVVVVDPHSFEAIKQKSFKLYYGFTRIQVRIYF